MMRNDGLHDRLRRFPRETLAHLPTPLEELPSLSGLLAPLSVYMKRDDQTGLAFGGNKARKLEFIMADAVSQEADTIVTWAGVQSNWCRQVAAAAARMGLRAVLVLVKKPGATVSEDGNLLLDRFFGADVRIMEASGDKGFLELEHVRGLLDPVLEEEQRAGRKVYLAPVGGSLLEGSMARPLGSLGYVEAFAELLEQARERGFTPDAVVLASGSAGTQAGLLAGAKLLSPETRIVGISVAGAAPVVSRYVRTITEAILDELGEAPDVADDDVVVLDEYLAEGYGVLNQAVTDAIGLLARKEGILLDPVYSGKAMAGFLDLAGKEYFRDAENAVFLHTGGTPALFPYREGLLGGMNV
jgi:L-cysteate sulfo-lyase